MSNILTYFTDKGVSFNSVILDWGINRKTARSLLNNKHSESDSFIDLSKYNDGNNNYNIIQRRDIYQNFREQENYFFFNYDKEDCLKEIEIHNGIEIVIGKLKLSFDINFQLAVSELKTISRDNRKLSNGEYLFTDLKLLIADSITMGGEGNTLSYFYCAKDVSHLNESEHN